MVKFGFQVRHDYVRKAVGVLGLMACVGLVACGSGDETASTDVPSLGGTATTERTTSTTVNPEKAAQNFVKCLRDEGLEVADPEMGSDGNIDMRSIFESANIQPGSDEFRTAMDACREFLDNAGFGPSEEDRAQRQEAMLALRTSSSPDLVVPDLVLPRERPRAGPLERPLERPPVHLAHLAPWAEPQVPSVPSARRAVHKEARRVVLGR